MLMCRSASNALLVDAMEEVIDKWERVRDVLYSILDQVIWRVAYKGKKKVKLPGLLSIIMSESSIAEM